MSLRLIFLKGKLIFCDQVFYQQNCEVLIVNYYLNYDSVLRSWSYILYALQ